MTRQVVFPVTRMHEPLRVEVEVQNGRVADAWISGTMFRGFEFMMVGRDPRDAVLFTQRICGICSSAHAVAGGLALEQAFGVQPTPDGQLLINLILAADFLQNHLRHFYLLAMLDYVTVDGMPPFAPQKNWDLRLPKAVSDTLVDHAKKAVQVSAKAHSMFALFGGKAPMQQTIIPTGVSHIIESDRIMAYSSMLKEVLAFIEEAYIADVLTIAQYYPDYYELGAGYGNLLSYGMFLEAGERIFPAGVAIGKGAVAGLSLSDITESTHASWYGDQTGSGEMQLNPDKEGAYSWVKAPRYQGLAVEGGPLARGWISGEYHRGVSVMDRLVARAKESLKIAALAEKWLGKLAPGAPAFQVYTPPERGEGIGLTDSMRGALGHWLAYENGRITRYQIITPTGWNFSPRDEKGLRGPVEEALIGIPVKDPENLVEIGRVIRSFDPCFSCAVHAFEVPSAREGVK
ncbi:MAG: Periplasmic [NiFeSe] hydrogenase large subunit [Firmicutes bacterium]|nr:Periplasmic [NiFeSe] hydrogenase large subunit [Bacillota bacterium]